MPDPTATAPPAVTPEVTADELQRRQAALQEKMARVSAVAAGSPEGAEGGQRVLDLAVELQREAQELEGLARRFEAQQGARAREMPRGVVQVQLTPAQRQLVRDEVGIEMDLLVIPDATGTLNQTMPMMTPPQMERLALEMARQRKRTLEAQGPVRAQVSAAVAELERHPQVKEKLDELRRDPEYLGGLLNKG